MESGAPDLEARLNRHTEDWLALVLSIDVSPLSALGPVGGNQELLQVEIDGAANVRRSLRRLSGLEITAYGKLRR